MAWLQANWGAVAGVLYALADFVIYLSPALKSNGLAQLLLSWLKGQSPQPPQS